MKKRDLSKVIAIAIIFVIGGFIVVTQLQPSGAQATAKNTVEVASPIPSTFNSDALQTLADTLRVKNYSVPIDLKNGLGNTKPLGSFQ
jgi:uncharacterized membrane protein YozB (DUF420 family)